MPQTDIIMTLRRPALGCGHVFFAELQRDVVYPGMDALGEMQDTWLTFCQSNTGLAH